MTELGEIRSFAQKIAELYSPEKIILFGSHARGDAGKYSDVDLLVLMDYEGPSSIQTVLDIRKHIPFSYSLDLLVKRPKDFNWRVEQHDFFLQEILETGIVLYEAVH
jgi:predicted nucleotidyltransferase